MGSRGNGSLQNLLGVYQNTSLASLGKRPWGVE